MAEDDDTVRDITSFSLRMYGYNVLTARDGDEALKKTRGYSGSISLLISDVVMPNMGGRELAEKLLQEQPAVKVLYMSGYTDDSIVLHGVLGEGINYLEKPFSPESLARRVREVLDAG